MHDQRRHAPSVRTDTSRYDTPRLTPSVEVISLPHHEWPEIVRGLPMPWPRAAMWHDVRWHKAEEELGRPMPSVRALAARWGCSRGTVQRVIVSGAWIIR